MDIEAVVREAFSKAYEAMERGGFSISGPVRIAVDPNLAFMGYTYTKDGVHTIVVSGMAIASGLLDGLLVHEMSHVYMGGANHPSHDEVLVQSVLQRFMRGDYRDGVLHEIVNHVKNVYADDVAFAVFKEWRGSFSGDMARQFFLNWIKTKPMPLEDATQNRWVNGSIMVSNAFAIGTVERHGYLRGYEGEFATRNVSFLNRADGELVKNFDYFRNFFASLEVKTDASIFRKRLLEYLERFTTMVEKQ